MLPFSIPNKSIPFSESCNALYMLMVSMEKEIHMKVYQRILHDFNITKFKKYFYCLNISYFQLTDLLSAQYPGCKLYFRVDHIV